MEQSPVEMTDRQLSREYENHVCNFDDPDCEVCNEYKDRFGSDDDDCMFDDEPEGLEDELLAGDKEEF